MYSSFCSDRFLTYLPLTVVCPLGKRSNLTDRLLLIHGGNLSNRISSNPFLAELFVYGLLHSAGDPHNRRSVPQSQWVTLAGRLVGWSLTCNHRSPESTKIDASPRTQRRIHLRSGVADVAAMDNSYPETFPNSILLLAGSSGDKVSRTMNSLAADTWSDIPCRYHATGPPIACART